MSICRKCIVPASFFFFSFFALLWQKKKNPFQFFFGLRCVSGRKKNDSDNSLSLPSRCRSGFEEPEIEPPGGLTLRTDEPCLAL